MALTSPKGISKVKIWQYHQDGFGPTQIARKKDIDCTRETVIHHLKRIERALKDDPLYLDRLAEKEAVVAQVKDQPALPLPKSRRKK